MNWQERFSKETRLSFDCNKCKYTKYKDCCPEENDCKIVDKYHEWFEKKANKLKKDNKEYTDLFDMQTKRIKECEKLWQKTTGNKDTLPDLGDLLKYLLNEINELKEDRMKHKCISNYNNLCSDCNFVDDCTEHGSCNRHYEDIKDYLKRLEKENKFFRDIFDMIQKTSKQARDFMREIK